MDSDNSMLSSPLSAFAQSPSPPTSPSSKGTSVSPSSGRIAAVGTTSQHTICTLKISSCGTTQKADKTMKISQPVKKTEGSSFQVLLKAPPTKSTTTKATKRTRTALPDSRPETAAKRRKLVDSRPTEISRDASKLPKDASKTTKNPAKPSAAKKKATAKQPVKTAPEKAAAVAPTKAPAKAAVAKGPKVRTTEYLDLDEARKEMGGPAGNPEAVKLDMLLNALRKKKKIVVIAGAGISVSAGIPDFRSGHGLFKTLKSEHKLKASGKQLFDASVYKDNNMTESFHAMVRKLSDMTKAAEPTPFHHMLASLAEEGRLLRLYTQNIDCIDTSLEPLATNVPLNHKGPWPTTIQLHGSVRHMVCSKCNFLSELQSDLFEGPVPPSCARCHEEEMLRITFANKRQQGVGKLRPRIVLYNEGNPDEEAIGAVSMADLRARPDAVLVVGTTMKIPGLKRLVKELCAVTRGRRDGFTAWINLDPEPQSAEFRDCWDLVVKARCDDVATLLSLPRWDEYRVWAAANATSTSEITAKDEKAVRTSKLEISLPGSQEQKTSVSGTTTAAAAAATAATKAKTAKEKTAKAKKCAAGASSASSSPSSPSSSSSSCSVASPKSSDTFPLAEGFAADADSGLAADATIANCSKQQQTPAQAQNQGSRKAAAAVETTCVVSAQENSFSTSPALYGKVVSKSNPSSNSNSSKADEAKDPAELALGAGDDVGGDSSGSSASSSASAGTTTDATTDAAGSSTTGSGSGAPYSSSSRDTSSHTPVSEARSGSNTNTAPTNTYTTTSNAAGFKKLSTATSSEDEQLDCPASLALTRPPSPTFVSVASSSSTSAPSTSLSSSSSSHTSSTSISSSHSLSSQSSSSLATIPTKTTAGKNKPKQQSQLLFTSTKRALKATSTSACAKPSPPSPPDSTSDSCSAPSRSSLELPSSASSSSSPPPPPSRQRTSKPRATKSTKSSGSGSGSSHTPSSSNPSAVSASSSTTKKQTATLTSRSKISTFVTTIKKSSSLAYRSQSRFKVPRPITVEPTNQSSSSLSPARTPEVAERPLPTLSSSSPPPDSTELLHNNSGIDTAATLASGPRASLDTFNSASDSDFDTDSDTMAGKDESGSKKRTKKYGPTFKVAPMPPPAVPVIPGPPFKMSETGSNKPYKCTASSASSSNQAQASSSTTIVKPALSPPTPAGTSAGDTISPSAVPRGMESLLN